MAIKVPDEMVFYPEKDAQSERLLCWIPPQDYEKVAIDDAALKRLRRNYPRGIEIRMRDKELEQEGIHLEVPSKKLENIYRTLQTEHTLPERIVMNRAILVRKGIRVVRGTSTTEDAADASPNLFDDLSKSVAMAGDEEPPEVFRRLSVRQMAVK